MTEQGVCCDIGGSFCSASLVSSLRKVDSCFSVFASGEIVGRVFGSCGSLFGAALGFGLEKRLYVGVCGKHEVVTEIGEGDLFFDLNLRVGGRVAIVLLLSKGNKVFGRNSSWKQKRQFCLSFVDLSQSTFVQCILFHIVLCFVTSTIASLVIASLVIAFSCHTCLCMCVYVCLSVYVYMCILYMHDIHDDDR